jgi:hypothetical protein
VRNFAIAYAFLVALPIGGLLGVLRYGRSLSAPISVDGIWKLQSDPSGLAGLPCGESLFSGKDAAFTISQSGSHLMLDLNNVSGAPVPAALEGTTIKTAINPPAACSGGRELALIATLDSPAPASSLHGTISINDCPSCTPVEFRATRTVSAARGAR